MKISWHPSARVDLAELTEYIAKDNPDAAYRIHDEIKAQVEILRRHPEAGRLGRIRGTRELVVAGTPYIAAYRITGDSVVILRLLHGARRWPKRLQ
ncbi:MAG TPA: type II toxin-antitoxin system RelE/ParE family toxin [Silvibacterium sp.]|nr:type II toxin-antitoxin system RelE/ParE family toxin [Silvibacterium sp.]